MLTHAIGFIQNVQLSCFAIVFLLMAANDRNNRSLRWFAYGYLAGFAGGVVAFFEPHPAPSHQVPNSRPRIL